MVKQRSLVTLILLSIITCGIYGIVFWYQWTEDVNKMCQGDGQDSSNYIVVILLSMVTCGIYGLYWYYKMGNRLQQNAPRYGMAFSENGTSVLLWMVIGSLLCGIGAFVAMYILIKNTNSLANAYNAMFFQPQQPQYPPQQPPMQ